MTETDDKELRRLCSVLEQLEKLATKSGSIEREALRKAGFALNLCFRKHESRQEPPERHILSAL